MHLQFENGLHMQSRMNVLMVLWSGWMYVILLQVSRRADSFRETLVARLLWAPNHPSR